MKKLDKKQKQTFIYICVHAKEIFSKLRWPSCAEQIQVQGVWYDRKEFERLKELYEARKQGFPFLLDK